MSAPRRHSTWIAVLATLALAWHALLPLAAAAGAPRTYVTLCTALGVRVVALDEKAPIQHGGTDHCPLCRIAAGGDAALPVAAWLTDRVAQDASAVSVAATGTAIRFRWTPATPRAPPAA
jgi:hypothetical protein